VESFLRKLDCRTKLLLVLLLSALVFVVDEIPAALLLLLWMLGLWFAAKMPLKKLLSSCKMIGSLTLFITLMQALFGPGSEVIGFSAPWGRLALKGEGLLLGLLAGCRLGALSLLAPMLALTSGHEEIALALTRLGLPYRAAFALAAAFNLIPVFEEEGRGIMEAQKLRGLGAFEKGSFFAKMKAYPALALPLLLGAMRRSRLMGLAMDSRAFGAYKTRTWPPTRPLGVLDFGAVLACVNSAAAVLVINFMLKAAP
jgi:energy-coupling factor transport system permease protein